MTSTRSLHRASVALAAAMLVLVSATGAAGAQVPPELSADRYGTAARAALDAFPDGADVAVLASGEEFADALAAAPLAAAYDAPILLSAHDVLPDATRDTLAYLGVADVLVMGGADAISNDVTNSLHVDYQVSRVAGGDRYATAARAAVDAFPDGAGVAVLASGEDFADALAAGPLAAFYDAPILLTGHDQLPDVTRDRLAALNVGDVLVMGGADAVSNEVTNSLHADYQVHRVAGADRYETAVTATLDWTGGADLVVLASGESFADALAAGPLAAFYDAPILLTGHDQLPDVTRDRLAALNVGDVLVMGGADAVSNEVTNSLHADYQVHRVAG